MFLKHLFITHIIMLFGFIATLLRWKLWSIYGLIDYLWCINHLLGTSISWHGAIQDEFSLEISNFWLPSRLVHCCLLYMYPSIGVHLSELPSCPSPKKLCDFYDFSNEKIGEWKERKEIEDQCFYTVITQNDNKNIYKSIKKC